MQTIVNAVQDSMGPVKVEVGPEYKHRPGGETMKALAWYGSEDVRMVDVPIPDITDPRDVILKITGTTICGSDLHLYHSEMPGLKKGDILGHEFMGLVDRVGSEVTKYKPGDKVVSSFQFACGSCDYCAKKLSSFCRQTNNSSLQEQLYGQRDAAFAGYGRVCGGYPGGQAEYIRVPYADTNLLRVPEGVADEEALYLSDVLPTSYHSVVDTGVQEGDIVAIFGLGPIGLAATQWALLKGASKVYAIDTIPSRLALAKKYGPNVVTVDFKKENVTKFILGEVPAGVDCAIDAGSFHEPQTLLHKVEKTLMLETDSPETINQMMYITKNMGRCGIISAYAGYTNHFNIGLCMERGIRLIGNGQAPVHLYWEEILNDYIVTGKFDVASLVTHRVGIDDFPNLYKKFASRYAGVIKVFVETAASDPPAVNKGFPQLSKVSDWAEKVM